MLIVREVFIAKPGQASKLAKLFKKVMKEMSGVRILTDVVGEFNTVVIETEAKNLAEFEKQMEEYQSGKLEEKVDPETLKEMAKYTEMYGTGRREVYQIID